MFQQLIDFVLTELPVEGEEQTARKVSECAQRFRGVSMERVEGRDIDDNEGIMTGFLDSRNLESRTYL